MRRRTLHQLGINLISNLGSRLLSVLVVRLVLSFVSVVSTLFLSLRYCIDGDIWVSLTLRRKSDDAFLCVIAHDNIDSVRKGDKGASLQKFLCCVTGIVERGPHFRGGIEPLSCFDRMRLGVLS